jgi:hypothetical protein
MKSVVRFFVSFLLVMSSMYITPFWGNQYTIAQEGFYFEICPNQSLRSQITITANADNDESCHVTISWSAAWLDISPSELVLPPGGSDTVVATICSDGFEPGLYADTILLQSNCKPQRSEIPVQMNVLHSTIQVEQKQFQWDVPSNGSVQKNVWIFNRQCDCEMRIHLGGTIDSSLHISIPSTVQLQQGEKATIPIEITTKDLLSSETFWLDFVSYDVILATIQITLSPIGEIPIITLQEIATNSSLWVGKEVMISGYLCMTQPPILCDRIPYCSSEKQTVFCIEVEEAQTYASNIPKGDIVFCTLQGTLSDRKITMSKAVQNPVQSLLSFRSPQDPPPWKAFQTPSTHFLLFLQSDSIGPEPIQQFLTNQTLQYLSQMPIHSDHATVFLPFANPYRNIPASFSRECIHPSSIEHIKVALSTLNQQMRETLRSSGKPLLWIHLSGWWNTDQDDPYMQIQGKPFSLSALKRELEKLSILGPIGIVLETNLPTAIEKSLSQVGNCTVFHPLEGQSDALCCPISLTHELYRTLPILLEKKEFTLNPKELLQNLRESCPFSHGFLYTQKLQCKIVDRKKSISRKNMDIVSYRLTIHQTRSEKQNPEKGTTSEKTIEITLDYPILTDDTAPFCPPLLPPIEIRQGLLGKTDQSAQIHTKGIVTKVNEKEEHFWVESFFDIHHRVEVPERTIEVKVNDHVDITGTLQGETTIIPETIEILEKECAIQISDIESKTLCPTCFTWDHAKGGYTDYMDVKYILSNTGDIDAGIIVSSTIDQIQGSVNISIKLAWKPTSFPLAVGSSYNLQGEIVLENIPELIPEEQLFEITTTFLIAPDPCPKTITKKFQIRLCPTKREVQGRLSFLNAKGKECGIGDTLVRLYLRYEPQCGHDPSLTVELDPIPDVHGSAKNGLPHYSLYVETKTDADGFYHFSFIDKDCDHRYRVIAIFRNDQINLTYKDCTNTFFASGDISGTEEPCKEVDYTRNIFIGQDTDLQFPSDFPHDGRSMAQIYCHMQECFSIFGSLECDGTPMIPASMKPLLVCGFSSTNGTFYQFTPTKKINIDQADSGIHSNNRPHNREWHEFGHFLHDSLMGLQLHPGDINHEGYRNPTSHDSFAEGFAEFTSLLMAKMVQSRNTCCDEYAGLPNGIYRWGGGATDIENDRNHHARNGQYGYFDASGNLVPVPLENTHVNAAGSLTDAHGHNIIMYRSEEEFAVVALLLDLVDNAGWYDRVTPDVVIHGSDDDGFSLPNWRDIFCLIQKDQPDTVKDLYDSLKQKYQGNISAQQKINAIFVHQGFFEDRNDNGSRDAGEAIGSTYRPAMTYYWQDNHGNWVSNPIPAIASRPDLPVIPGSCIRTYFLAEDGQKIDQKTLEITSFSLDSNVYFTYEQTAFHGSDLYIYAPPNSSHWLRITLAGEDQQVLLLSTQEIWDSVVNKKSYITDFTWDVRKEDQPSVWHVKLQPEEKIQMIQNTTVQGRIVYWNESSLIEEVELSADQTWITLKNPILKDPSGIIHFEIDGTKLPVGTHQAILTHQQNGNIIDYVVCVDVLPSEKIIHLTIGEKKAFVNEMEIRLDAPPFIQPPGRTMVPLRFIAEAFGASIDYAPKTGLVTDIMILFECIDIHLYIGKKYALIMNETTILDAPPLVVQGRTFVPLRFISEAFGADIEWESKEQRITIRRKET